MTGQAPRNSILGDIVRELYRFVNEGKMHPEFEMKSPTDGYKEMPASEFLKKVYNRSFIVAQKRLPAEPNIQAILARGPRILIETSKLDFMRLEKLLHEADRGVELRGRTLRYEDEEIARTKTQNVGKKEFEFRTLTCMLAEYGTEGLDRALEVVDIIYNQDCFEGTGGNDMARVPTIELRLDGRAENIDRLELIQVPKLALMQNSWLMARRAFGSKIMRMSGAELDDFLSNYRNGGDL